MMLCDADFEELFPDLFGREKPNRSPWRSGHPWQSARPGSDLPHAAREGEGKTANWGPNRQVAPVRATLVEADNLNCPDATCRIVR